jgi:hypothetical protein
VGICAISVEAEEETGTSSSYSYSYSYCGVSVVVVVLVGGINGFTLTLWGRGVVVVVGTVVVDLVVVVLTVVVVGGVDAVVGREFLFRNFCLGDNVVVGLVLGVGLAEVFG